MALVLAVLLLVVVPAASLPAVETETIRGTGLTVQFEGPLKNAARDVLEIYPAVRDGLETTLGWKVTFDPTVVLLGNSGTFQRMAGNNLFAAFAVPGRYLIVMDYSKMTSTPFTLEITLRHELCHLLLHHYIPAAKLPKWLDEGVSQWVSGGIGELLADRRSSPLKEASLSGKFIPLAALQRAFPVQKRPLILAYEESRSVVEYMEREFGRNGVLKVLDLLKKGHDADGAVSEALGVSLPDLERTWQASLKSRISWISYLSNNLYGLLFFVAAVITVIGFIRVVLRKRAYRDDDDEDGWGAG